ncbi:MAG TPA: type II secretion system minor pseudopilin GspK [Ramlibacter sp.]
MKRAPALPASQRQRGAALLSAMLTVALVATFAAAALWQQWRTVEVEAAERARIQAAWLLVGGLDWARLLLREDGRAGGADHLGEPWAVPLEEARLSDFLAAERNVGTDVGPDVMEAFLSGQIIDQQSMMNVTNLVDSGKVSVKDMQAFGRLFALLELPQAQLDTLTENLRFALDTSPANRSSPLAPLPPQRIEQLVWLGVPESTVAVLRPHVTILPARTHVNLNTASAEVMHAAVPGLSMADAQRLVAARERSPFRTIDEARLAIGAEQAMFAADQAYVSVNTLYFEVRSRLRLDQLMIEERALVRRDGIDVRVVQRWRAAAPGLPAPAQTAPR